jgi:hypothetical protein
MVSWCTFQTAHPLISLNLSCCVRLLLCDDHPSLLNNAPHRAIIPSEVPCVVIMGTDSINELQAQHGHEHSHIPVQKARHDAHRGDVVQEENGPPSQTSVTVGLNCTVTCSTSSDFGASGNQTTITGTASGIHNLKQSESSSHFHLPERFGHARSTGPGTFQWYSPFYAVASSLRRASPYMATVTHWQLMVFSIRG